MNDQRIHFVQLSILRSLRHSDVERFTDLMQPTGMTSDVFKFHLQKLVKLGLVEKAETKYRLTVAGKEYANSLDETRRVVRKQPKLSMLITARAVRADGQIEWLYQRRLRSPFYKVWGNITGPVKWGIPIETAAESELYKQTGLQAHGVLRGFRRTRDFNEKTGDILEDKLFCIVEMLNVKGVISNTWPGGVNAWLTVDELQQTGSYFPSSESIIDDLLAERSYVAQDLFYPPTDY